MAKNNEKLLIGAALVGAAIGCGIAFLTRNRKKDESWDEDFDEFQDEFEDDDDLDEKDETPASREYVTIPKEGAAHTTAEEEPREDVDAPEETSGEDVDASEETSGEDVIISTGTETEE